MADVTPRAEDTLFIPLDDFRIRLDGRAIVEAWSDIVRADFVALRSRFRIVLARRRIFVDGCSIVRR
jgi:hypothetical protein